MTTEEIENAHTSLLSMENGLKEVREELPTAHDLYEPTTPDAFAHCRRELGAIGALIEDVLPKIDHQQLPTSLENIHLRLKKMQTDIAEIEAFMNEFQRKNFPSDNN